MYFELCSEGAITFKRRSAKLVELVWSKKKKKIKGRSVVLCLPVVHKLYLFQSDRCNSGYLIVPSVQPKGSFLFVFY